MSNPAVSPYPATDGPNDHHLFGGQLHPGLADYSPTLLAPKGPNAAETIAVGERAKAVTLAMQEVEKAREELERERAAWEAGKTGGSSGGKKKKDAAE